MIPERQSLSLVIIELIADHWLGYSRKENSRGLRTYFFEEPLEFFNFFTLPLEIPDKTKLHLWKFHNIALDSLGIPRPNHQNPLKFHIIFSWLPLEIPFAISLIPLEIPYPPPLTLLVFLLEQSIWRQPPGYVATYLPTSCVVFYVLGSHQQNFGMVANSVYITGNLSSFFLLIFDENLTDFIALSLQYT